jgi:hypothetical protein
MMSSAWRYYNLAAMVQRPRTANGSDVHVLFTVRLLCARRAVTAVPYRARRQVVGVPRADNP